MAEGDRPSIGRGLGRSALSTLLVEVVQHLLECTPHGDFFRNPVPPTVVEDYRAFVPATDEMYLSRVLSRIDAGDYSSVGAFKNDLELIFKNAMAYNSRSGGKHRYEPVIHWARELLAAAEEQLHLRKLQLQAAERAAQVVRVSTDVASKVTVEHVTTPTVPEPSLRSLPTAEVAAPVLPTSRVEPAQPPCSALGASHLPGQYPGPPAASLSAPQEQNAGRHPLAPPTRSPPSCSHSSPQRQSSSQLPPTQPPLPPPPLTHLPGGSDSASPRQAGSAGGAQSSSHNSGCATAGAAHSGLEALLAACELAVAAAGHNGQDGLASMQTDGACAQEARSAVSPATVASAGAASSAPEKAAGVEPVPKAAVDVQATAAAAAAGPTPAELRAEPGSAGAAPEGGDKQEGRAGVMAMTVVSPQQTVSAVEEAPEPGTESCGEPLAMDVPAQAGALARFGPDAHGSALTLPQVPMLPSPAARSSGTMAMVVGGGADSKGPGSYLASNAFKNRRHKSKVYLKPNKVIYLPTTFVEEEFDLAELPLECVLHVEANGMEEPSTYNVQIKPVPRQGLSTMYCMTNVFRLQQQYLNWEVFNWTRVDARTMKIHLKSPSDRGLPRSDLDRSASMPDVSHKAGGGGGAAVPYDDGLGNGSVAPRRSENGMVAGRSATGSLKRKSDTGRYNLAKPDRKAVLTDPREGLLPEALGMPSFGHRPSPIPESPPSNAHRRASTGAPSQFQRGLGGGQAGATGWGGGFGGSLALPLQSSSSVQLLLPPLAPSQGGGFAGGLQQGNASRGQALLQQQLRQLHGAGMGLGSRGLNGELLGADGRDDLSSGLGQAGGGHTAGLFLHQYGLSLQNDMSSGAGAGSGPGGRATAPRLDSADPEGTPGMRRSAAGAGLAPHPTQLQQQIMGLQQQLQQQLANHERHAAVLQMALASVHQPAGGGPGSGLGRDRNGGGGAAAPLDLGAGGDGPAKRGSFGVPRFDMRGPAGPFPAFMQRSDEEGAAALDGGVGGGYALQPDEAEDDEGMRGLGGYAQRDALARDQRRQRQTMPYTHQPRRTSVPVPLFPHGDEGERKAGGLGSRDFASRDDLPMHDARAAAAAGQLGGGAYGRRPSQLGHGGAGSRGPSYDGSACASDMDVPMPSPSKRYKVSVDGSAGAMAAPGNGGPMGPMQPGDEGSLPFGANPFGLNLSLGPLGGLNVALGGSGNGSMNVPLSVLSPEALMALRNAGVLPAAFAQQPQPDGGFVPRPSLGARTLPPELLSQLL